jgi:hypothetical protein
MEPVIPHALREPEWKCHTLVDALDLAELTDKSHEIISQQQKQKHEASTAVHMNGKRKREASAALKREAWPAEHHSIIGLSS